MCWGGNETRVLATIPHGRLPGGQAVCSLIPDAQEDPGWA